MSHSLTRPEREAFLADLHVGVIGLVENGRPLAVPIWYDYEPGGDVWVIMSPESVKGKALAETPRYSLVAQSEEPPYKYVSVEGPVTSVDDCPEEVRRDMAYRYLGQEFGDMYLESTAADSADNRIYRMTPETWRTVDYGKDLG